MLVKDSEFFEKAAKIIEQAKQVYKFIFDRINDLDGKLQVIIVDHADFEKEEFINSVVEDWH